MFSKKAAVISETEVASVRGTAFEPEMVFGPVMARHKGAAMAGLSCEVAPPFMKGSKPGEALMPMTP